MRIEMTVDNDALIREFTDLGVRLAGHTKIACDKMADVIRPALIRAAPFDRKNVKTKHLKEVICKTAPKKQDEATQSVIWVKPRGIPNAEKGKKASKNWNKDKHIYKIVVSEYGRSDMPAKPFWTTTVQANAEKALQVGTQELKKAVENK